MFRVSVFPERLPEALTLPVAVRFPVSVRENAVMPLVVLSVAKVGEVGSLGKITLGTCLVVMPGPLISISYFPGAA